MEQRINSAIISEQGKVNRWRENLSSVKSAERLSPQPSPFSFISEFTPGRSPTSVPSVRNPLHSRAHCDVIWKFTRGRNLSAVLSARSPVQNRTTWELILWGFTLARNPIVVLCATSRLFCQPRWKSTSRFTRKIRIAMERFPRHNWLPSILQKKIVLRGKDFIFNPLELFHL
jgi:hypothetical protein